MATEMAEQLRRIRAQMDETGAGLRVSVELQYRQATDIRLLADQLAVIDRAEARVAQHGAVAGLAVDVGHHVGRPGDGRRG
ncbi:hypothetical protein [Herbidospora sp. RD11066]